MISSNCRLRRLIKNRESDLPAGGGSRLSSPAQDISTHIGRSSYRID